MINIPHTHKFEWDYEGWRNQLSHTNPYTQENWNQTLIAKINQISNAIYQTSLRGGADRIRCNQNILKILKTLAYFYEDNTISGRYKVIIDDLILDDVIYVYSSRIHEKPFLFPLKELEVENFDIKVVMSEISFKVETKDTKKEGDEHRKKQVGKIMILNYED